MKYRISLSLIVAIFITQLGCQKSQNSAADQTANFIDSSRSFFEKNVSVTSSNSPARKKSETPRRNLPKSIDWQNAVIIRFGDIKGALIPLRFPASLNFVSTFDTTHMYDLNELSKLFIYRDRKSLYHAQILTCIPDRNVSKGKNKFSGLMLVETWDGDLEAEYKFNPNGQAMMRNLGKASRTLSANTQNMLVEVCYEISGYNYATNDPNGGVAWHESLGCDLMFLDPPANDGGGPSPSNYGSLADPPSLGSGGFGFHPKTIKSTVTAGSIEIADMTDYVRCFQNFPNQMANYKVMLCVDEPNPGTRDAWNFSGSGSANTGNPVNVGHTFLVLTETTPNGTIKRNFGFYPTDGVNPLSPRAPGKLYNDSYYSHSIALNITVDAASFFNILNYLEPTNNGSTIYDLNSNNCSTFAVNACAAGGITLPRTIGYWPNGQGMDPGDLGEDIREMNLSPNMSISTDNFGHFNAGKCN
jgi:hypothetical protein